MNMPNNIESIESKFNLNLVDVESLVDILAEQEALVEFDKEMEEKKGGFLGKVGGIFRRMVHRIGRGAEIEAKKYNKKREIYEQLESGKLSPKGLSAKVDSYIKSSMEAIGEGAYLKSEMKEKALSVSYEAGKKESFDSISVDGILKDIIHTIKMESDGESGKDITDIEIDMETRILQKRLKEELNISVELGQLKREIADLETKLLGVDLKNVNLSLNFFNIGIIGNEKQRAGKKSYVESIFGVLDKWDESLGKKGEIVRKAIGVLRHPTLYAAGAFLGTFATNALANTILIGGGGLATGSMLAGVRGAREGRDHLKTQARAEAIGREYNLNDKGLKKVPVLKEKSGFNLISAEEILDGIINSESKYEKISFTLDYFARRQSTIETGRNWINYGDENTTAVNTKIIKAIREVEAKPDWYKEYASLIENKKNELNRGHIKLLEEERAIIEKYGLKQGAIFALAGTVVGGAISGFSHLVNNTLEGLISSAHASSDILPEPLIPAIEEAPMEEVTPTEAPSIVSVEKIDGPINRVWLSGNELKLWEDGEGGLTIKGMIGNGGITPEDLANGKTYAIVTAQNGETFRVLINPNGGIDTSSNESLKRVIEGKTYKFVEIAKDIGNGKTGISSTATGAGTGDIVIPPTTEFLENPPTPPVTTSPIIVETDSTPVIPEPELVVTSPTPPSTPSPIIVPAGFTPYAGGKMVEKPKSSSEPEIVIEFKDPVLEAFYKGIPPEVLMSDDQFEVEITDEKVIVTGIKIRGNFIRSSSEEVDTDDGLLGEGNNSVKVPDTEMGNFKNPPEEYCQQPKN